MKIQFEIGQTVMLNGKEYKIVGTKSRSFLLEREGKTYKATADKLVKILVQNAQPTVTFLERRLAFDRLFNKNARLPETEAEIMEWFERLRGALSPENLSCDGEASPAHIRRSLAEINGCWSELEARLGRKVQKGG